MKWLGQYIQSFTARFRNDVYLESLSTTTETSALVVDSDGKISKNVTSGVNLANGADNRVVTAVGTNGLNAEANLTFNGSTLSIEADSNTTTDALFIDANSLTTGSAISVDVDDALTTSSTKSLIEIDYDKSGVLGASQLHILEGININLSDAATNNAAAIQIVTGVNLTIDAASNQGSINHVGYSASLTDGDPTGVGFLSNVENGGVDFKATSSADTGDTFTMATTAHGATTLTTTDDDAEAAHFEIAADGDITLDANGQIKLEPVAGNNILLDGTVTVDGGAVGGLVSLTSSDDLALVATGNDVNVDTDFFRISSASTNHPRLYISATEDATGSGMLVFEKDRGAAAADGDRVGQIAFVGEDASQNAEQYATISCFATETQHGDEAGSVVINVVNDGTERNGITMTGDKGTAQEVDVQIANGAGSVTTVAGTLELTSTGAKFGAGIPNVFGSTIKVLPSDFMANEEPGVTKTLQFVDNDASGIKPGDNGTELLAFVSIPEGMKATHVDTYADDNLDFEVYELNIHESVNDLSAASKGSGNCNTTLNITDVDATATNYLLIQVITVAKADRVWGAKVTIAAQG